MYDAINSRYTYKNSSVLENKLNITTEEKLKEYETKMVALKLASIDKADFKRTYDEEHLKAIHKYLFEDVYDFAGQYRLENITKDNFIFSQYQYIDENIKEVFKKTNIQSLEDLPFEELIIKLSDFMTDLNVLHPFREGNGRATREFIREFLDKLGFEINWFEIDYNDILRASMLAVIDDSEQIELLRKSIKRK
jgi:fic protein family